MPDEINVPAIRVADMRQFIADRTIETKLASETLDRLTRHYGRWAVQNGRPQATAKEISIAMGYAGHALTLTAHEPGFRGIRLLAIDEEKPG